MAGPNVQNVRFSNMFESLCGELADSGNVQETSAAFAEMPCDMTRIAFVLNQPEVHKHITPVEDSKVKNASVAAELRERGNEFFQRHEYELCVQYYTKSIYCAPYHKEDDTNALALAYGNRSAALYHLKQYTECIADIDNALQHDYPQISKHKLFERKGRCYSALDKLEQAQKYFTEALACLDEIKMDKKKKKAVEKSFDESLDSCRKRQQAPKQHKFTVVHNCPTPDFESPQNEVFSSLTSSVDVTYSDDRGRYIVAKEYIPPGQIVMIEKPFASVLLIGYAGSHCHHCMKRSVTTLPCLSCVHVGFCSKKCRSEATYHRYECKCLGMLRRSGLDKFSYLALRAVTQQPVKQLLAYKEKLEKGGYKYDADDVLKGCTDGKAYLPDNFHAIHSLVTHANDRKGHDLYRRAINAIYLLKCLQHSGYFSKGKNKNGLETKENLAFIGGLLLSHLQLLPCNAHEISELQLDPLNVGNSTTREIGAAIYSTLSLFNHSCAPAVTRHFHGDVCVVRTIRAVHPGEEVSDNYGAVYEVQPRETRREEVLAAQYFFECKCDACVNDWPQYDGLLESETRWRCRDCLKPLENHSAVQKNTEDHTDTTDKKDTDNTYTTDKKDTDNTDTTDKKDTDKTDKKDTDTTDNTDKTNNTDNDCKAVPLPISELRDLLKASEGKFSAAFAHLLRCEWQKAVPLLLSHLEVLDNVLPPHKAFSSSQEALKQCYNFMANCYITRQENDIH